MLLWTLNFLTHPHQGNYHFKGRGRDCQLSTKYLLSLSLATESHVYFREAVCPWKKTVPSLHRSQVWLGGCFCCVDTQRDTQGSWLSSDDGAMVGAVALFPPLLLSGIQPWWLEGQPRLVPSPQWPLQTQFSLSTERGSLLTASGAVLILGSLQGSVVSPFSLPGPVTMENDPCRAFSAFPAVL